MHLEETNNRRIEVERVIATLPLRIESKCKAHKRYHKERKWQSSYIFIFLLKLPSFVPELKLPLIEH